MMLYGRFRARKELPLKNLNVRWKESIRKQSMNPMDYKPIDSILNNVEDTV